MRCVSVNGRALACLIYAPLGRHPLEFSHVMAEKNHPEKGKRPAKKARPGPGPRPKTRARGDAPRGRGTHELALQPLPHSKHHFKAANWWRMLCTGLPGFQGARQSSSVVRRCGVRPDYVDLLIECHEFASRRGFLHKIEETETARLPRKASHDVPQQLLPSMEALSNAVRTEVARITELTAA